MKTLLLSLLLTAPIIANAQSVGVAIDGGASTFLTTSHRMYNAASISTKTSPAFGFSLYGVLGHFAAGVNYMQPQLGYSFTTAKGTNDAINYGSTAHAANLYGEYITGGKRLRFNIGASIGWLWFDTKDFSIYSRTGTGALVGVRGGASYEIYKGLGADVRIGYNRAALNVNYNRFGDESFSDNIQYMTMTAGIHYRVNVCHRK